MDERGKVEALTLSVGIAEFFFKEACGFPDSLRDLQTVVPR